MEFFDGFHPVRFACQVFLGQIVDNFWTTFDVKARLNHVKKLGITEMIQIEKWRIYNGFRLIPMQIRHYSIHAPDRARTYQFSPYNPCG